MGLLPFQSCCLERHAHPCCEGPAGLLLSLLEGSATMGPALAALLLVLQTARERVCPARLAGQR